MHLTRVIGATLGTARLDWLSRNARYAEARARDFSPVIADIRSGGTTSLRAIAAELNARGMQTRRGGRWPVSNTGNLLRRLGLRKSGRP